MMLPRTVLASPNPGLQTLALLVLSAQPARAADLHDVQNWIDDPGYVNGGTVQEQIHCYALPYGGIGFLSHVLTYLTVFCLAAGRSPWRPWKKLRGRKWDLALALAGMLVTVPLTGLTMYRCRHTWPFILVGIWKLVFSFTLSSICIHASRIIDPSAGKKEAATRDMSQLQSYYGHYQQYMQLDNGGGGGEGANTAKGKQFTRILHWLWLCVPASIIGFVGVMSLVVDHFSEISELRTVTYVFGGFVLGLMALAVLAASCFFAYSKQGILESAAYSTFGATAFCILLPTGMFAFYMDWVMAALAGDMLGVPANDNALLYWSYFVAKRFPIISF